jgi:DNA-binding transcriptional MerR regulator
MISPLCPYSTEGIPHSRLYTHNIHLPVNWNVKRYSARIGREGMRGGGVMGQRSPAPQIHIGELAAELGINAKTIRYYEDIGLLPPATRGDNGYRLYDDADRERLRFISKAKAVGLMLEEIGEILALRRGGAKPCEHVLSLLDHKLAAVDEQLRMLSELRQELLTLREEATITMGTDACVCGIIEQHKPPR